MTVPAARPAPDVAILLPDLAGGGAERSMLLLADALARRGRTIDLVLERLRGGYVDQVPDGLRIVTLRPSRFPGGRLAVLRADPGGLAAAARPVLLAGRVSGRIRYVPGLARYLREARPPVLLSAMTYTNLQALWARRLAGAPTRVVVSERNTLSARIAEPARSRVARWRAVPALVRRLYREADAIVAVSDGVADDLARVAALPRERIVTVYNPVVGPGLTEQAAAPLAHPWFDGDHAVVLAVGRLEPAKDFTTLLHAFALLRRRRAAKLVILGEGRQRAALTELAATLGIGSDVDLAGWTDNPFAYMARADLFVLSSRFEGLPGVLIQALACGCPTVATDCPSGPREILEGGRFGPLVPVGDPDALAGAMADVLATPPDRDALRARGAEFSVEAAADAYQAILWPDRPEKASR
jgi:glycosyltransferase involved in cell wall biosynthesis